MVNGTTTHSTVSGAVDIEVIWQCMVSVTKSILAAGMFKS